MSALPNRATLAFVEEHPSERIGRNLQTLVNELIDVRRRLAFLHRENRELRAQIAALTDSVDPAASEPIPEQGAD